jgi:hypothetical protein
MMNNIRRGQSLTEFAIILPIFLLIIIGVFDLGRAIFYYSGLHNAAREGARFGAVNPCDPADIEQRARDFSFGIGDAINVSSSIQYNLEGAMDRMIVSTTYQFSTITPFVGSFIGEDGTILLSSQSKQFIEIRTECP